MLKKVVYEKKTKYVSLKRKLKYTCCAKCKDCDWVHYGEANSFFQANVHAQETGHLVVAKHVRIKYYRGLDYDGDDPFDRFYDDDNNLIKEEEED